LVVTERGSRTREVAPADGSAEDGCTGLAGGRQVVDPAVEAAIAAFVATAPPLPEDTRARLARLLHTQQWSQDAA